MLGFNCYGVEVQVDNNENFGGWVAHFSSCYKYRQSSNDYGLTSKHGEELELFIIECRQFVAEHILSLEDTDDGIDYFKSEIEKYKRMCNLIREFN